MDTFQRTSRPRWIADKGILTGDSKNSLQNRPKNKKQFSDRFIATKGSMDFKIARNFLVQKENEDKNSSLSPAKECYNRLLSASLFDDIGVYQNETRVLNSQNKNKEISKFPSFDSLFPEVTTDIKRNAPRKFRRHIPQTAERTLDAPDLLDDYYLNLLDWSKSNIVSIALGNTAYMWDASKNSAYELLSVADDVGPITSVCWAPNSKDLAVGMNNSAVQLWDHDRNRQIRTLYGHRARVGALAWKGHVLSTGSLDGLIFNHDVRIRDSIVQVHRAHRQEVCGLKWSLCGKMLASGGNDNLLHIWDERMSSSNHTTMPYLHRLTEHCAAVKALAWCPFENDVLASGGGSADRCIKLWNANTGTCLNSVDTSSQVCSLLWNNHEQELLSSHGYADNQLTLWKYSSMKKFAEFSGHTARVLHLAQSPDGCTVASAGADETLRFWPIFGNPSKKEKKKAEIAPFSNFSKICIR